MKTELKSAITGANQYTAPWTKREEDWIIHHYPTSAMEDCLIALPGRSISSIKHKASRLSVKKSAEAISKQNSEINSGRVRTEENRNKISASLTGKKQSPTTKRKRIESLKVAARRGDTHPNWKGDGYSRKSTMRWRARRLVPKGKCANCGRIGRHVHHKDGNPYNNDIGNLTRLCIPCHIEEHRRMRMFRVQPEEKQTPELMH